MRPIFLLTLLALLSAGCNYPGIQSPTLAPTVTASPTPPPTEAPRVLPDALYFLSGRGGSVQVWRLEADGLTLRQLTDESADIDEYDVSAGRFAYRIGQRILLAGAEGNEGRVLVDNSSADPDAADFAYTQAVSAPLFAPGGAALAYGQGGVWLFDLGSGETQRILENAVAEEEGVITPIELYTPVAWSPSGEQLLIAIAQPEGSTLGVWDFRSATLLRLDGEALLCCQAAWAPDSDSVLLASATIGLVEPGLWRYDIASGARSTLIETISGETYNFVGWPLQLPNGNLRYFYASSAELPEGDLPLYMVEAATDGSSGRSQLRSDAFSIREVLWAADGSLAMVAQAAAGGEGLDGPVVLAYADERPLQVLVDFGYALRWGE